LSHGAVQPIGDRW